MSKIGAPVDPGAMMETEAPGGAPLAALAAVVLAVVVSLVLGVLLRGESGAVLLGLLSLFATAGVFVLLAGAFGLLHFGVKAPSDDLAAAFAAGAPDGILITGEDGGVVFANPAYCNLVGSGEETAAPLEQALAGQPGAAEPVFRLVRAARRGKSWQEEFEIGDPGAPPRRLRVAVRPLPYRGPWRGRVILRVWDVRDVTEDRRRETDMKRRLDELLGFWEDAQIGFIAANEQGRVRYLNRRLAGWLNVDAGAAPGLRLADILAANGAALLLHGEAGDPGSGLAAKALDLDMIRHDGAIIPVRFFSWRQDQTTDEQRDDDGPLLCSVVLNRLCVHGGSDACDEGEGGAAKGRLPSVFNAAPIAVARVNREGKVIGCNGAFLSMFPLPRPQSRPDLRFLGNLGKGGAKAAARGAARPPAGAARLLAGEGGGSGLALPPGAAGTTRRPNAVHADLPSAAKATPLYDLLDEASRAPLAEAVAKAVAHKAGIPPVDVALQGDGKRTARLYVCPAPEADPAQETALVYGIDASELRALEEQIAQSQKMQAIGQLAGGVAHDFNNVLTAIIGFSDLLLANHRPADPAFNDIMAIKQNANRAAGLVRQLLAFSRRQTLRPQVLSLTDVLEDLTVLLKRLLGEKVAFKVNHGRDLWLIRADINQFEQVIINLAVNARDAMPDGGQLTIRTANVSERESLSLAQKREIQPGEYVLCEVSDTGTGIPPDLIEKIFEPFFSTKEVGKGTGLGLSTVYGIVKQTGGYVFVDSEPGQGAVFRIYLPRHVAAEQAAGTATARPGKKDSARDLTGSATVLLVEDEEAVRSFAARALTTRGYRVLEAGSGVQALEVMEREGGAVDLVVSDVVMPEMDGPTLLKRLRERKPELKIIFVSGYAEEAFKNNLDAGQKFTFLPKPFSLKKLAAAVKEALDGAGS